MNEERLEQLNVEHELQLREAFRLALAFARGKIDEAKVRFHVQNLVEGLLEHMAEEEQHFLPWLAERLPERADEVRLLVDQHLQLAMQVADFHVAAKRPERFPVEERLSSVKEFVRLLDVHTSLERELSVAALTRASRLARAG